ncbi:MAG TPA: tripartite tricarboxylate transporter substrate-binding protein, partial [Burkholderiales bacterium]|nr:tripartite tricarboxylate transporter substrate-binding protein [Burkholderiales bacterium]
MRGALAALALISALAQAQPVTRIVVPFAAGGVQDIVARSFNAELGSLLGRTVIVENRAGAGGTIGTGSVAKSAPDGQTLILAAASHTIAGSLYTKLPYDPLQDFTPIAHIGNVDYVLLISSTVPAKTVAEFVAYAKANPGKLNFAVSGIGGAPQLAGIEFAQRTGVTWTYIPYKGGSDAVAAVAAGQADVLFNGMLATWPTVQGGRLRAIAISSAKRVPSAPDTPTVAEQGLPGFETGSFQGVVGPNGLPRDTLAKLNTELVKVLNTQEMKDRFAKQGTEVRTGTPES